MMTPARKEPDQTMYTGRFAAHLRKLREKAKLTPEQAADAIGVTVKAVYSWEAAGSVPRLEKFPEIAKLYGLRKTRDLLPPE